MAAIPGAGDKDRGMVCVSEARDRAQGRWGRTADDAHGIPDISTPGPMRHPCRMSPFRARSIFREPHPSAICWLNEPTADGTAWRSPGRASPSPRSATGWRPSRSPTRSNRRHRRSARWRDHGDRLAGAPCLSGSLSRTLIDRQNRMADSENTGGRPGRPSRGACHVLFLSNKISRDPRLRSAELQADQLVRYWRVG